jgi:hypothetical protein
MEGFMMRRRFGLSMLLIATAALALAVGRSAPAADPHAGHDHPSDTGVANAQMVNGAWVRDFNEYEVGVPTPLKSSSREDVYVHMRDGTKWAYGPDPMPFPAGSAGANPIYGEQHGEHCEPPPAVHAQSPRNTEAAWDDAVFVCGSASTPHMMTAINGGNYGLLYYTPAALVDFSAGAATIEFDVSSLRTSGRDWWDVWVTPYDENLTCPLESSLPDCQGQPKDAMHFRISQGGAGTFEQVVYRDFVAENRGWRGWTTFEQNNPGFTYSATRRDKVVITLSTTKNSMCLPTWGICYGDDTQPAMSPALTWNQGVVQIGHHSYNPGKACDWDGTCGPGTWHWDNIKINPAVPVTMIRANERFQPLTSSGTVATFTFPQAAPTDAYLRVAAVGEGMQYSEDNGATWNTLHRQPSYWHDVATGASVQMTSYWQPVTAGITSVKLRATNAGGWEPGGVDYAAIWSLNAVTQAPTPTALPPTNTPLPTATPVPTSTPVPPTATPNPSSTVRINGGTASPYTDGGSNVWAADTGYTSGGSGTATYDPCAGTCPIAGTTDDALYSQQRYWNTTGGYAISVPNGTYDLDLRWAELDTSVTTGGRVFDVSAEGALIENHLDVRAAAGGVQTALARTYVVTVSDGTLNIDITNVTNVPILNAIGITPHVAPTATPVPPTATPTPVCRGVRERDAWDAEPVVEAYGTPVACT